MEQTKSSAQQEMEALDAEYARLTAEDHALSIQERDLLLAEQKFLRQELQSLRADYKRWKNKLKERIQESISINLVRDRTLQDLRTQGDLDRKEKDACKVELSNMRQVLSYATKEKHALKAELSNMRKKLEFAVEDKRIAEQGLEEMMQQASHSAARTPQAGIAHAPLSNTSGSNFKFENSIHRSKRRLSTTSETPPLGKLEVSHKDKRLKREPSPKPGSRIVNPYSPHKPHGDSYRPREPSSHQSLRRTLVSRPQDEKESPKLQ